MLQRDEIIKMARQAGIIAIHTEGDGNWHQQFVALEAFAKLVYAKATAKEREACAMTCIDIAHKWTRMGAWGQNTEYHECAEAIRARGEA